MTKIVRMKNGVPLGSGIVNWSRSDRDVQIQQVTDRLAEMITSYQ